MLGQITIPTLIVAGAEDSDLGEEAQRRLNLPHYPNATVHVVLNAAHLIPYEQPGALAAVIAQHVDAIAGAAFARRLCAAARLGTRQRPRARSDAGAYPPYV